MQSLPLKSWSFISGIYNRVPLKDKLHVFIRQKAVPWDIFFKESYTEGNLLDYGCGHGVLLSILRQAYPNLKLYGIDHDDRKRSVVQRCLPDVEMVFAESLDKLYREHFDYVVICDMLYCNQLKEQSKILSDIRNCLKPGGRLIIKETVAIPRIKYYFILLHELIVMRILKLTKGNNMSVPHPDYYVELLRSFGFKVMLNQPVGKGYLHPHHLFLCVK